MRVSLGPCCQNLKCVSEMRWSGSPAEVQLRSLERAKNSSIRVNKDAYLYIVRTCTYTFILYTLAHMLLSG